MPSSRSAELQLRTAALGCILAVSVGAAGCSSEARGESDPNRGSTTKAVEAETTAKAVALGEAEPLAAAAPTPKAAEAAPAAPSKPCPDGMAFVDGGTVRSLEADDAVPIKGFCLDTNEVTVGEFRACADGGGCVRDCQGATSCDLVPKRTDWGRPSDDWTASMFCNGTRQGREDHPVNCVSIEEAKSFCAVSGRRLPTGDEWEWAARGGTNAMATPWGGPVAKDEICWGKPKKRDGTCPPGMKPKDRTAIGIEALGGGVSEWVIAPKRAGGEKSRARYAYGASWYAIDDGYARAALSGFAMPAKRAETTGFRCAVDATK